MSSATSHVSRGARASSATSVRAISIARAVARTVPPFALDRDDVRRLAGAARGVRQVLRDDLFAAERDHQHGADVRMPAIRRQRLVRRVHVGAELAAPGGVRQRGADRRDRRGDALGDDRRADHGRHDEQMVAHADAPVGPAVAEECRTRRRV